MNIEILKRLRNHDLAKRVAGVIPTETALLSLIVLLGAYLRFKGLVYQGLWFDELLTVVRSSPSHSFSDIISLLQTDPHPPLFYLMMHYWLSIFGAGEVAARFLVALIGCGGILSVYWLGKECLNKKAGLVSALLISVNFFTIYYSQEVRPYIMLFLFCTLSYTFFIRLIREQSRKNVILYGVFSALMLYSHYYGLIHLLSQLIFLSFYFLLEKNLPIRSMLKHFSLSGLIVTILYSPWIPMTIKMFSKTKHWNRKPQPNFFLDLFKKFFGNEPYIVIMFSALLLVLLFYFLSFRHNGESSVEPDFSRLNLSIPILFSWVFLTLFIPYFRSLVTVPMYFPSYAIGTLPAFVVMISVSIVLFKNNTFKGLLIFSIVIVSLTGLFLHKNYYSQQTKQDWRGIVRFVMSHQEQHLPSSTVHVVSNYSSLYDFYFSSFKARNIRVLPPRLPELRAMVKDKSQLEPAVWFLPGHSMKPNKGVIKLLKNHLLLVEKKKFKMGVAYLFKGRKVTVTPPERSK